MNVESNAKASPLILPFATQNSTFIGAFLQDALIGFTQIIYGDNIAIISQILAIQKHWDRAVNNALLAKAVEVYLRLYCKKSRERKEGNNLFWRAASAVHMLEQ
jgi:hypothetical protein